MKPKAIYNVVDASKMPEKTRAERQMRAVEEAIKMAKENPDIESTLFKFEGGEDVPR